MSSIEEQSSLRSNSIKLSTLNSQVREKLVKFDTTNDGELSLEEAIHGLVTLQKQSNNYKKMIYLLIPLMAVMMACVLGVNILAIQLTKELKTSSVNVPVLTNNNGEVLHTSSYLMSGNLFDVIFNKGEMNLSYLKSFDIGNTLSLPITSSYLEGQNQTTTFYASTPIVVFSINKEGQYNINYMPGFSSQDIYPSKVFELVEEELKSFSSFSSSKSIKRIGYTRGKIRFGCGLYGTICR